MQHKGIGPSRQIVESKRLAVIFNNRAISYLGLFNLASKKMEIIPLDDADRSSVIFWSPDHKKIAHISGSGIISIIDTLTGRTAKIDQIPLPASLDWSHDSKNVIYSNGKVIRSYDISSHTHFDIDRPGALYVQYFPGDREILYQATDPAGLSQLYRSNRDGSNEVRLTNNTNGPLNDVRLSPDGRFVLYTTPGASISEIYTIELLTGTVYKIPGGPEAKNYYPAWSPDSTQIAYCATFYNNGRYFSQIRIAAAKGESSTILAISSCYATPVTWSPDNTRLAYLSGCRNDNPPTEVWSINLKRMITRNILFGQYFYNLDWS